MADAYEPWPDGNLTSRGVDRKDVYGNRNKATSRNAVNRYHLKRVSVVVRVEKWILYKQYDNCICDRCIANEIGVTDLKKVAMATRKLALREPGFFIRWHGQCATCGNSKSVIRARRLTWA